jgi:hypothetical protein
LFLKLKPLLIMKDQNSELGEFISLILYKVLRFLGDLLSFSLVHFLIIL